MFSTLPASAFQGDRDARGLLTSFAAHTAAIASAVWLTTGPAAHVVRYDPVELPVYVATPAARERRPLPAPPSAPRADVPTDALPPILPPIRPATTAFDAAHALASGVGVLPAGIPVGMERAGSSSVGGAFDADAVDQPVVPIANQLAPRYPESLRQAGAGGKVLARFIVDTLGRVESGSIEIVESSHALFAEAVRDALGRERFAPAESGGRRVRQLVLRPFLFRTVR